MSTVTLEKPVREVVPKPKLEASPYHGSARQRVFAANAARLLMYYGQTFEMYTSIYLQTVLDEGDTYFTQIRDGVELTKLRTMRRGTEQQVTYNRDNPRIPNDAVRLIRDLRLDEIPQLRSVIRGDMTMVGFRPIDDHYRGEFKDHLGDRYDTWAASRQLPARPALISPAQVLTLSHEKTDPDFFDIWYEEDVRHFREASLHRDVKLLGQAVGALSKYALDRVGALNGRATYSTGQQIDQSQFDFSVGF